MKLDITKAQLQAIADMANTAEAMLGGGGDVDSPDIDTFDKDTIKQLKLIDKFLANNGYSR
jgi:hypothetical protein